MKNITKIFIMVGTVAAVSFLPSCKKSDNKTVEGPMPVSVAYPETDSVLLRHSYPGFLTANREVDIVARVNGTILSHPYTPGQVVHKGDVLFTIDDSSYRNDLQEAQASLDNAKASYEYYSKQYEAMTIALKSDAVSEIEVLQAKSNMDEAEAQMRSYSAAVGNARTTLGHCVIRAPFDGRVTDWTYDVGSVVTGEGAPVVVATIYDDSTVFANIEIDNNNYMDLVNASNEDLDLAHMPVTFSEELPRAYTADLTYMAPEMDKTTGTLLLKARIDNPEGDLRSGMYVTLGVPYASMAQALIIEDAAISTDQLGKYVYVVNDSDRVVYTPVEIGELVTDTRRIVTKGLNPRSRYVTKALLKVRDGERVKPIMEK